MTVEQPLDSGPTRSYGSDAVVDLLREMGVRYVPLNPGSSFRGLHDSLVNHGGNRDPQLLLCLHEEIAVSLAHGYAKATGDLAVAAVHDLVGLMHASMAVYDAFCDRTPVLVLGGSGPMDPAQRRPVDWIHSATTQAQLVRDYVVWDAEPATPEASVADVVRARQRALSAPRGPAYVSLDAGVQEAELSAPLRLPDLSLHAPAPPIAPAPASLVQAAELLASAERPVVVAGRIGLDPRATAPLVALVELLGAAYRDDRNTVAFPSTHPQNATGDPDVLREADVVLAVDVVDLPALLVRKGRGARGEQEDPARNGPLIIDLSSGDLGLRSWSNAFAAPIERSVQLLADPLLGLTQLTAALRTRVDASAAATRRTAVCRRVAALRARQWAAVEERWDDTPISPSRLVAETWLAVRDVDHLLCVRNTRTWPEGVWKFPGAGSYLGHSGGGGVGYGPGAFVGGALAARDRGQLGVGILGDGDLLMAAGALWTAVHYEIPMLVVINDNSSFYNDEPHQAEVARHRGRPPENSWIGMRITDPPVDLAGLARSYGCWAGDPVSDPADLGGALAEAVEQARAGAVAVVHVRTAPR
ncbi:MAG: thiamine pyrophosphate-dependent enzyme possible carboligase or decarboxylase [Blastococcus sp.]|jgi:thiamine pyrophosphate-dependent acetolactate synthase large subunit-like protein|nr:thiamine pyrophosphate-dependent enzyme possible carboligase or decarboxylase [Blastococcus sp.]